MSLKTYWPTQAERTQFFENGFLVVPDALSPEMVTRLTEAIDRCGHGKPGSFHNCINILHHDDAFCELLDTPKVFAKICGFLGWNIWVNHTHYNVRPPDVPNKPYNYAWHRDGGSFSLDLQDQAPMTAIKVGFYLSDLSETDRGNTFIVPLSQEDPHMSKKVSTLKAPPPEAVPLVVKPGSAVMFQQRAWHSQGSPNYSEMIRKTIFVQWAFRWLFPVDKMELGDLPQRVTDPIRRQMLGLDHPRNGKNLSPRYYPSEDDIPLKRKLITDIGISKLSEVGPSTMRYLTRYLDFSEAGIPS